MYFLMINSQEFYVSEKVYLSLGLVTCWRFTQFQSEITISHHVDDVRM